MKVNAPGSKVSPRPEARCLMGRSKKQPASLVPLPRRTSLHAAPIPGITRLYFPGYLAQNAVLSFRFRWQLAVPCCAPPPAYPSPGPRDTRVIAQVILGFVVRFSLVSSVSSSQGLHFPACTAAPNSKHLRVALFPTLPVSSPHPHFACRGRVRGLRCSRRHPVFGSRNSPSPPPSPGPSPVQSVVWWSSPRHVPVPGRGMGSPARLDVGVGKEI